MEMENLKKNQYSVMDVYKTYIYMFLYMFIFSIGFSCALGIFSSITSISTKEIANNENFIYIQGLLSPLMFFSLFLWQNRKKKFDTLTIIGINKRPTIKGASFAILLSIFCLIFFAGFSNLFDASLEFIGFNPSDSLNLVKSNVGYLFLGIFVFALLPAICEELIFRGIVFQGLKNAHKPVVAILISSLMFSIMHGSLQQTLYQFLIGVVLAICMYATENILYPIILHFCNNAIVVIMDFFSETEVIAYDFNFWSIALPIILLGVGIFLIVLIFKKIKKIKLSQLDGVTPIYRTFKTYTYQEKRCALYSAFVAIGVWIITTIGMF